MSGLIACTGEFIPIPGQIFSLATVLINKGIPGIIDLWSNIAGVIESCMKTIGACGK